MDKDAALTLALAFIERVNREGWVLADFEREMYAAIAAIEEALVQPVRADANPNTEILVWNLADTPPDANLLVLLGFRGDGWEAGYWDGQDWRSDENAVVSKVTHWAHPEGPR